MALQEETIFDSALLNIIHNYLFSNLTFQIIYMQILENI